jgi:NAD(P)-dependent dehydrogenase (short-subunit alcohol dehydrogenase family)
VSGRSVIVTGGFGALGSVVAAAFAEAGDRVARVDFAPSGMGVAKGMIDIGGLDLSDEAAATEAIEQVKQAFGGIDVLVNIAGGFTWETLQDGSPASWQRMYAMNVLTAVTITKAALPTLVGSTSGRIINIGAGAAIKADMGMGAYAASKAGVHRFTEALAAELAGKEVTVNAILPSIIDTPTNRKDMPDADFSSWVKPQAIADIVLFLASPAARSIHGALIPVTRGA